MQDSERISDQIFCRSSPAIGTSVLGPHLLLGGEGPSIQSHSSKLCIKLCMTKTYSESETPWKPDLMELVKWVSFNRDLEPVTSLHSGSFLWPLWSLTLG